MAPTHGEEQVMRTSEQWSGRGPGPRTSTAAKPFKFK